MDAKYAALAVGVTILVATAGFLAYTGYFAQERCSPYVQTGTFRTAVASDKFGSVTEFRLPGPSAWPNGIAVAGDGSVWFGLEAIPGVAHLYPNGTLLEYPWPSASSPGGGCDYRTGIWGIAIWDGMVWGTDGDQNAVVGLNQSDGTFQVINTTGTADFPYALTTDTSGSLWFTSTSLSGPASVGKLAPGPEHTFTVFRVPGIGKEHPVQMQFVNATSGYFVALDPLSTTGEGHLYGFAVGPGDQLTAIHEGGNFTLRDPDSLSISKNVAWVAQHGPSSVVSYNFTDRAWTTWPTSTVNYTATTLPYFVDASGTQVWFNEHYGNRIAFLDSSAGTLTEFSEADPPIEDGSLVQQDLTIAAGVSGLWFTSTTGNYVGYVDETVPKNFTVAAIGGTSAAVQAGGMASFRVQVSGSWATPLSLQESDSESFDSVPKLITIAPGQNTLSPASGSIEIPVNVTTSSSLSAGRYTLALTATNGLLYQTVFFFITVT